jgi:hypothetical protein
LPERRTEICESIVLLSIYVADDVEKQLVLTAIKGALNNLLGNEVHDRAALGSRRLAS